MNSIICQSSRVAVLASGGLESAVLLEEMARTGATVYPLYIQCGLRWEAEEMQALTRLVALMSRDNVPEPVVLEQPVSDIYDDHWSVTGQGVPSATTPAAAVFLPGRNVLLLSKALLWCHMHDVPTIALGTLGSNPFPDASVSFLNEFARVVNQSVGGSVTVRLPFVGVTKADILRRGSRVLLDATMSCLQPVGGRHCGACNKCEERREAFRDAGIKDSTQYRSSPGHPVGVS